MKINPINFGAITEPQTATNTTNTNNTKVTEETGSKPIPNDYDDTRIADKKPEQNNKVSTPIEKPKGTVEDLMQAQASTTQMAKTYGFSNVEQAAKATSVPSNGTSGVSAPSSSMSFNA